MRLLALPLLAALAGCGKPAPGELLRPDDLQGVAQGAAIYAARCAACHGATLEGQPNWRDRCGSVVDQGAVAGEDSGAAG